MVEPAPGRPRRKTSTSRFGSSRRESHDASLFYERFVAPEISTSESPVRPASVDELYVHDARDMSGVLDNSVALVVTSPPYFAGKEYEAALGENGVPGSYFEYLEMLRDVFAECGRVLEPGGRIAVNVANLGRKPFRSLAGDVTTLLQDLGLLLRGEIVWWKGRAAGGSTAWGTFQRPNNPVLRDVTERVVVASKGRFDRAVSAKERDGRGQPSISTITREEFMEATTDLWEIAPESATRVGHPAPFPIELPKRLIDLYTYKGDLVLDPFVGSGTTAVAAVAAGRHYLGFDTDPEYVAAAESRITEQRQCGPVTAATGPSVELPAEKESDAPDDFDGALRQGRSAKYLAELLLENCGFGDIRPDVKWPRSGIELSFVATDKSGGDWAFEVCGAFTATSSGLRRADTLWKAVAKAAVLHQDPDAPPLVLLTTDRPAKNSSGARALAVVTGSGKPVHGVICLLDTADHQRLRGSAKAE